MSARAARRRRTDAEEESYFISMADMMVGLVFVFIILLLYFALQFRQTSTTLTDIQQTRATLLQSLDHQLLGSGLQVSIDTRTGVLRLPEDVLFDPGQAELTDRGRAAVAVIAQALAQVLPCYSYPRPRTQCRGNAHDLDAIFIEGHTDTDLWKGRGMLRDNLDLSVVRATNTYRALVAAAPELAMRRNRPADGGAPQAILSVAGYGADRPVDPRDTPDAKRRNRRIDLRFLMVGPETP
jgi:flagellar motor protein MotB